MRNNALVASALAATTIMFMADCSLNQSIRTIDGKTITTSDRLQVGDDTGLISHKDAETGRVEQINRDQVKSMGELDN